MNKRGLEARENWIAARIDELMDDDDFLGEWADSNSRHLKDYARQQAEREHATIMADLEEERINQHRGHHEF